MRVLFYGGCHAVALEKLFRTSAASRHEFSSLQNFELINSGTPFPYEQLTRYDAVVFSPILNKDAWNTDHLVERCAALRIPTVSFPWLQWNGYFPDVMHVEQPPHIWGYRRFADRVAQGATPAELLADARNPDAFNPLPYAEWSFNILEENEAALDIRVSAFIRQHYQAQRLFWTPNHPTLALYTYVQKEIARRLGIGLKWFARHDEQHPDAFIILPGVRDALGLDFTGEEYRPAEWNKGIGVERFVQLTFELFGNAKAPLASVS